MNNSRTFHDRLVEGFGDLQERRDPVIRYYGVHYRDREADPDGSVLTPLPTPSRPCRGAILDYTPVQAVLRRWLGHD